MLPRKILFRSAWPPGALPISPTVLTAVWILLACGTAFAETDPSQSDYYSDGELAGSLRSGRLAIYDADPDHVWNRLFTALYVRPSNLPSRPGVPPVERLEGGDWIDFLAWAGSDYWSTPETCDRLSRLLDEFLASPDQVRRADALNRALLLRDLWAAYDFLIERNIAWQDDTSARTRREKVCRKLATAIRLLALTAAEIDTLPETYPLAVASGRFAAEHEFDPRRDYLPSRLLAPGDEWVEMDFFRPSLHEDLEDRFITLHTRHYRSRSYFRVFYKYPGGREKLVDYLKYLDDEGIDWRKSGQDGFVHLKDGLRQVALGLEVALVQFMMTLDDALQPKPTQIVESVRLRTIRDVDGSDTAGPTNTGLGMNVYEYTLKRRLLFAGIRNGGLEREREDLPQFRVLFEGEQAPDWGRGGRTQALRDQCVNCHTPFGFGVYSLVSIVNQGGFDAGAQLGVAVPVEKGAASPRANRAARWKTHDEAWRRLLEFQDAAGE